MKKKNFTLFLLLFAVTILTTDQTKAQYYDTEEAPMMRGVTKNIKNGWKVDPIFTVGETNNHGEDYSEERFDYRVPGVMDGMYPFRKSSNRINLFVNHELRDERGYPYELKNGTELTGARITKFRVQIKYGNFAVKYAELAYDEVYDRYYDEVTDPAQLNEGANPGSIDGMDRLCSANGIEDGKYGFEDDIFLTGEETGPPFDARGGQAYALDVDDEELYCVPALGRAAWESMAVMDNHGTDKVVILIGDDRQAAPLLLYVGEKDEAYGDAPKFLKKNGLAKGNLYVWVADNGDKTPEEWNGTGTSRDGKFVRIDHYQPSMEGEPGWDAEGWADVTTQDEMGDGVDMFRFSRPEDLHTNPNDGSQAVFASTGRPALYPSDSWGTTYLVELDEDDLEDQLEGDLEDINYIDAELTIMYDGDDAGDDQFDGPDYGLRSPDNLTWGDDGYIYIQEDRSISDFCLTSNIEASVWQLNPEDGELVRILEMDRNAVPFNQTDSDPDDCGDWESSGIIDVSKFFDIDDDETLLLLNVQAHSNDNSVNAASPIGGDDDLSEGGQLLFAWAEVEDLDDVNSASPNRVQEDDTKNALKADIVYPNPTNGFVNLNRVANVEVHNTFGALVIEMEQTDKVDVSKLQTGIYFITLDKNKTYKIVIK